VELLLIRHAIPERKVVQSGPADPELSDVGHRQAALLADYLSSESLDIVYSSPLRRARQTAAPVAVAVGHDVSIVDGVAEFDRDSSEYVPVEELKRANDPRWQEIVEKGMLGSEESELAFRTRAIEALEGLVSRHPGGRIAVVCHGGVINSYVAHVLGIEAKGAFFYPNYTSIHRIAAARSGERAIVTLNETPHLRGTGLPMGIFQS
jgi:2,3-bisphosphoglycerate-dependent phosphoglycerate mutase